MSPQLSKSEVIQISLALFLLFGVLFFGTRRLVSPTAISIDPFSEDALTVAVLPPDGFALPVKWGDLGKQMTDAGVIDKTKLEKIYETRGGLTEEENGLLNKKDNGNIKITGQNTGFLLNIFWALGLGSKNEILEKGPMQDPKYGNAGVFASTGGWSLAKGKAMEHYSRHSFIVLTKEEQDLVERVAKNIYRPCCNNSTYFPDCNHGMAMLGLLELLASQGVPEDNMYKTALQVNSYWFGDTYLTIAKYFALKKISWDKVSPKEVLSAKFSSATGYQQILNEVTPSEKRSGGSCGV